LFYVLLCALFYLALKAFTVYCWYHVFISEESLLRRFIKEVNLCGRDVESSLKYKCVLIYLL